ncbi:MAG: hypothetical protein LUC94_12915 [Clostridiales bacterium]|nr:hypothetical protein [Clostridiales bacterium]
MIKMLNLYRCSSEEPRISEKDVNYFVTDYFDGIKVEDLNSKEVTLAECMGIKRGVPGKVGISHQRYCLFTENGEEDIFHASSEFPVFALIQVFINPDIYQAKFFDDKEVISTQNCMKRIDSCIASLSRNQNLKWQVFHLVTEGDFAVVVRSKFVHDAYDISTLIRSIRISSKGNIKTNAFFSYTICGILEEKALQHEHGNMISGSHVSWKNYLGSDDRIVIRMVYSPSFRIKSKLEEDIVASKNFLGDGYRLFGRYDHQESFTPEEFEKIYPYIRAFKFEKLCLSEDVIEQESDLKVKRLLYMLHMGYFSYLNERLILKYNNDPVLFQKDNNIWDVETDQTEWRKIYEENEKKIEEGRRLVDTADKKLMLFFQSAHNLKEYSRLLGRFYRVLYEMNHLQELRISTARLLIQANQMLRSMLRYIENAEKENCSKKILADRIEEYLRQGIAALEISIRYARNVNL